MGALIATFCIVFLRATQTNNVIFQRYALAAITSYALAICEVAILLIVVDRGWSAVPWIGTGGALGVTSAMWLHRRMMK